MYFIHNLQNHAFHSGGISNRWKTPSHCLWEKVSSPQLASSWSHTNYTLELGLSILYAEDAMVPWLRTQGVQPLTVMGTVLSS